MLNTFGSSLLCRYVVLGTVLWTRTQWHRNGVDDDLLDSDEEQYGMTRAQWSQDIKTFYGFSTVYSSPWVWYV